MEYFSAVYLDFYKSETGTLIVQPAVLEKRSGGIHLEND